MKSISIVLTLVVLLLLVASPVVAQSTTTGQISGRVVDDDGSPLPGVTVSATSPALQGERTVLTDRDGQFHLPILPTGTYQLALSLSGYQKVQFEDVMVELGGDASVDVKLKKGEMVEVVTVTAGFPLISTKTADNTTNMNAKTLDTIPSLARDFRDLTKYVPSITSVELNTTDASAVGFPSIRGEGQYGDNYLVDGLTVRDPAVKTPGTPLNFDAIEEVQIVTDGFSPEYGQALGGSVNVITKSGSNQFGGEVGYLYRSDSTSASPRPTIVTVADGFERSDPYVNVGGPILKDKLWYFGSYNRRDAEDEFTPRTKLGLTPGGVTDLSEDLLFGKLTWAVTTNHNLSGNYSHDETNTTGENAFRAQPEAQRTQDITRKRFRVNYQAIFSANSVLEAKFGSTETEALTSPASLGPAFYEQVSESVDFNNAWRESDNNRTRDDYALTYTHFWNPGKAGSHEFKGGYEHHDTEQNSGDNFSGRDEDVFLADGFDLGAKFTFITVGTDSTPDVLNEYGSSGLLKNSGKEDGIFVQDRWEFGKWNFMFGFRADKQKAYNDADQVFSEFDFDRAFSPRLSVTWDATGDGKNVFKAGWGRMFDVNSTRFGEFANTRSAFAFRTYAWAGTSSFSGIDFRDHIDTADGYDIHNPANWALVNEQSNAANPLDFSFVTKPAGLDRFLVEYDRQVMNDYAFKARYVTSESRGLIDDVHHLYNDFRVENTDLKRREYEAIEFEFNGNPTPNISFNTSWAHSAAKGTNPGQFESSGYLGDSGSGVDIGVFLDRPPSDPQFWCDFYGPNCVPPSWSLTDPTRDYNDDGAVNQFDRDLFIQTTFAGLGSIDGDDQWYGYLPYSIDDQVKLHGRFNIPQWSNVYVDAFLQWASGYHTQRRGFQHLYGDYLTFEQVPGEFDFVETAPGDCDPVTGNFAGCDPVLVTIPVSGQGFNGESGLQRGSLETSSFWTLDAAVGKKFDFGTHYGFEVRAELFNLFNNQITVALQDRAVDEFGQALTRLQPRSARLFARFSF